MTDPRLSILIVDDDPEILSVVCEILRGTPLIVNVAGSGADALAFLERQSVAVMFTDLSMPGMSGLQLVEAIRGRMPESPMKICIMSGLVNQVTHARLRALGVSRFLEKPFGSQHLLEMALGAAEVTMNVGAHLEREE